jgi:DegV family protein with EDD domain
MSGTYSNALSSKTELSKEYPGTKVEIIDSHTNCMALGMIVLEAARAAKANASIEEVVDIALRTRKRVGFYFVPEVMTYLKKGGRIGTAASLLGSILNIRPILTVDMSNGMTHLYDKARGYTNALSKIYAIVAKEFERYGLKEIHVHHINAREKATQAIEYLKRVYADIPIHSCDIGPVIGLHVGPGTIGIAYRRDRA